MDNIKSKSKKRFEMPHIYLILMGMMLIVVVLSFIIPSGEYIRTVDPESGRTLVDPNSYHVIDKPPTADPIDFGAAIYTGAMNGAAIIFQIIMVTGTMEFLEVTGSFEAGIGKLVHVFRNKVGILPAVIVLIFAVLGNIGMQESCIPFYPIAATIMLRAGYDRVSAAGAGILGVAAGFGGGLLNIFNVGLSQQILELPLFSGFSFRLVASIVFYVVASAYLLWYCQKIKKDPKKSIVSEEYMQQLSLREETESIPLTWRRSMAITGLALALAMQGYGPLKLDWGIAQITALYVLLAILLSIIFRINPNKACEIYMDGAKKILPAAFILAVANGVLVLMTNAKIIDTIIYGLVKAFEGKSQFGVVLILFLSIIGFEFIVSSGSGKAMLLMPILGPFVQIIGMSRQLLVFVFQYADGATQYIWPTSGVLLAGLGLCKVRYQDWVKFAWRPILFITIANFAMILLAAKLNIGPY